MIETVATVPTTNGSRYAEQLCKHLGHKSVVDWTDERGIIRFDTAVATLDPRPDSLIVTILANDSDAAQHLQDVVKTHLDRFAFREAPLAFTWQERG